LEILQPTSWKHSNLIPQTSDIFSWDAGGFVSMWVIKFIISKMRLYLHVMNLLREYVRFCIGSVLKESVFADKIRKMVDGGMVVKLVEFDAIVRTSLFDSNGEEVGVVRIEKPTNPCRGAWKVIESKMNIEGGFGPVLYDVMLEYSSMNGGGLMADRYSVSQSAQNIWKYYLYNRTDVQHFLLDDIRNAPQDRITPDDPKDDCRMPPADPPFGLLQPFKNKRNSPNPEYLKNPLSYVYRVSGTPVMDELRSLGILKEF